MAANVQITIEPYKGIENENFREFEQLFRGIIGVAAVPAAQQPNFLQLHLRDAALRFFLLQQQPQELTWKFVLMLFRIIFVTFNYKKFIY